MKHMYRINYIDVKDCFLYVPPNVATEEFAKVVYGTTGTAYFSVIQGKVSCNDSWNTYVGLNVAFAMHLGLSENELVTVTYIKSLPKLSSVYCVHSSDDSEILELSKDRLEEKILHQVKVVWPGQTLPVWFGKNFSINIKVESLSPPCSVGILCEGTELSLQPVKDFGCVKSPHQQIDDDGVPPSSLSLEFRACQMPPEVHVVGAALSVHDWPEQWDSTSCWCRLSNHKGSVSMDTPVVQLTDAHGVSKQQRPMYSPPNLLLSSHLLTVLGLSGNGHRITVSRISGPATPSLPTAAVSSLDHNPPVDVRPAWRPLFSGPLLHALEEGVASLELGLRLTPLAEKFNPLTHLRLSHNVLIYGTCGSGRSTVAQEIAGRLSGAPHFIHVATISCKGLVGKRPDVCGKILQASLDECFACQPSLLLLDDLDCLVPLLKPSEDMTPEGLHSSRIAQIVSRVIWEATGGYRSHSDRVVVVATALSPSNLSSLLVSARGAHVFTTSIAIPELDTKSREEMLSTMLGCQEYHGNHAEMIGKSIQDISVRTAGFVAVDLADLSERAIFDAQRRSALSDGGGIVAHGRQEVMPEDLQSALQRTCPLSLHGMKLADGVPEGSREGLWSGVGGLVAAKRKLEETVLWPLKYHQLFKNLPLKPRQGLLLYGPPGTGKTHLVSSLVGQCGIRLIFVKGPELLSKYIGASEEAVREIFQKAHSARPCVLFFDEFESLAPRRGHDSTGVTDRVVNQLLTQLDGVEEGVTSGMVIVAATTRPDLVDPALLRPGRLDTPVLCPMPQEEDRESILKELSHRLLFSNDVNLSALAKLTSGFTGADLQAVLYTSQIISLKSTESSCFGNKPPVVEWRHVLEALEQTKPSLTKEEAVKYEKRYAVITGDSTLSATMAGVKVSLA